MLQRFVCLSMLAGVLCGMIVAGCGGGPPGRRRDDGGIVGRDEDGDGISDDDEGRSERVDTDGDGTPDYLDGDSDGDGIDDAVEGTRDTDGDMTGDWRDLDSDGNGIPDMVEGTDDPDTDTLGNYTDYDDDGDTMRDVDELGPDPSMPRDTDGDGIPDFRDVDSDGDNIADVHEPTLDTNRDGVPDFIDLDTDGDGIADADEAGDTDLGTAPRDTDLDGTADFRDSDSDNDGLSDTDETTTGTNPFDEDSDDDGVTDLVEIASGTDPGDPASNPRAMGDFVFLEPYTMPPSPPRDTLDFATDIRTADVYFLMDTTGSMGVSIASLASGIATPTTGLIDRVRVVIPDVNFGVGDFKDYFDTYLYRNVQDISADPALSRAAAMTLSAYGGGDGPEADVPSLYAVASGMTVITTPTVPARTGCPAGTFGYPCFRSGAVPIVVLITDWSFHNDRTGGDPYTGYTDYATMLSAVTASRIRVIGIAQQTTGDYGALPDLQDIARDSGAVDAAGAPLVSVYSGGSISDVVVNQIATLAAATQFDISVSYEDDPADAVDTRAAFVDYIEADVAGDAGRGCEALPAIDTDSDGHVDTFQGVTAGARVCFDIVVRQNDTVMPTAMPQLFRATLHVLGDGFTELDSRDVFFLVPPHIEPPGGPG